MGEVFLGQSPGGRLVAVKLIRAGLAADREFRVRFAREVAAARHVSGMFTAPVVDADLDAPRPWLVTAYVPGPSLAEAVDSQGPLPLSSVLTLAAGLAEALEAIHAEGMVHRALKPSNVLPGSSGPWLSVAWPRIHGCGPPPTSSSPSWAPLIPGRTGCRSRSPRR